MKNLLKDLYVGDQAIPGGNGAFQQDLRVPFVRMGRSDQVHGNVRVDKNDHDYLDPDR